MLKKFFYAKLFFRIAAFVVAGVLLLLCFTYFRKQYRDADFGNSFGEHAALAKNKLAQMEEQFSVCASSANESVQFMQAIVFPEIMRYNTLKDDIETESLRTLYVQFGPEYANFSIGIFQMKPTFAEQVEQMAGKLLGDKMYTDLQLQYEVTDLQEIRRERIARLRDEDWQLLYLTAFVCICNKIYKDKNLKKVEKLQWYATVYNAGFDRSTAYLETKIKEANFYLEQEMPGKKFRYAALATWYYSGRQ